MKEILLKCYRKIKNPIEIVNVIKYYLRKSKLEQSQKPGTKILLVTSYASNGIVTVLQTIFEYCEWSRFSIDVLNVEGRYIQISKERLSNYSAIIIHNTADYHILSLERINKQILKKYNGIKVVMKQDEHFMTQSFIDFFDENSIDLVLTLWDIETAEKVYKHDGKNQGLQIMHYLTGYVPDSYKELDVDFNPRDIDIGYRGSIQPLLFGRLAYEKRNIGDRFASYALKAGLKCDISSKWEDRFMGDDWLAFLKRCKAVLGVESGSDIVDYSGDVKKQYDKYIKEHPNATEEEILVFVERFKGEITYRAISPRHLEAAACGALQVLYEGEYQGILKPYVHYVPLKRDYSNIEEVIDYIKDDAKRKKIVMQAREDIILSGKYSFRQFTDELDAKIEKLIEERGGN